MKIAFVLAYPFITPVNGIISQTLAWKKGLEELNHKVYLIDSWQNYDWKSFDIIHYFGFSSYMRHQIECLKGINDNIVVSPILDPDYPVWAYKIYANWGSDRLKLTNYYHSFHQTKKFVKRVLARSEFEKRYLIQGFGFSESICKEVPLSFDMEPPLSQIRKEPFCFHCSLLTDKRKNVHRLIEAARKYKFRLILGGHLRNDQEKQMLYKWIGDATNIEYHGFLSRTEMIEHYTRAQVFALPSINEGVGIVALEAASLGCDIVLTSLGGPAEYYKGLARTVNPYSADEIGGAVISLLNGESCQPGLSEMVRSRYSHLQVGQILEQIYQDLSSDNYGL